MFLSARQRTVSFIHRAGERTDVQCALPHSLELPVTDEWCRVENIESMSVVQTSVTPAQIHLRVSREMTDSSADELPRAYQYQRPQGADEKRRRQANGYSQEILTFSEQASQATSTHFLCLTPEKADEAFFTLFRASGFHIFYLGFHSVPNSGGK
jgi:hypothetical protein